jgi:hypothetical protein
LSSWLQLLVEAREVFGEALAERGRALAALGRDLGQGQPQLEHIFRKAQGRVDVAVLRRDHVDDRGGGQLTHLALEIGVRHRLEQDLQVEGQGDQRLRDRVQERALDVLVHVLLRAEGRGWAVDASSRSVAGWFERRPGKTTHARLSSSLHPDGHPEGPPLTRFRYTGAARIDSSRAAAAGLRKPASGPAGSSRVSTGRPRSMPSQAPSDPGVG